MDGMASTDIWGHAKFINPYVLKSGTYLKPDDYIYVDDWQPIADGTSQDIGVVINVLRGDVALTYTPTVHEDPADFTSNVYPAGDIRVTTENQVIWIKPTDSPISAHGEIVYNVPSPIGV
jgi:hypothetical protein